MPVQWDPSTERLSHFNLGSHDGVVSLPHIFNCLIDTPEFQRLRNIKQLGPANLVFDDADHSRFIHSLGTASFGFKLMMEMQHQSYNEKKVVDGNDILAVSLACLCHDIGHGPFSHLYEEIFATEVHERHEALSVKVFDKIFSDYPNVKEAFSKFFDEKYFQLVRQLIDPPDYCNHDNGWPLVVGKEKAYMFGVVSNSLNGLDVDKLDYLIRDSERSGVPVTINKNVVELLFKNARIVKHPTYGFSWIAFADKYVDNVKAIFAARKSLHERVYNHRVIIVLSEMIKKALRCAGDHLVIPGSNNNPVLLKNCSNDLNAYIKLNDSILDLIKNSFSNEQKMLEAKQVIDQIETRKLPRIIAKLDYLKPQNAEFENEVRKILLKLDVVEDADLLTVMKVYHFGKGYHNPIGEVLFFGRNSTELVQHSEDTSCSRTCLFVYGPQNCSDCAAGAIYQRLESYAKEKGLETPTKLYI